MYIVAEGEFFEVEADYAKSLNDYIGAVAESPYLLPEGLGDIEEAVYNNRAAQSHPSYLLLDQMTIRVAGKTTPVEACDLLTQDGGFIHVKRKLGSSSLSHLFSQGTVSAELFLMNERYRTDLHQKISEAERDRARRDGDPGFVGRFSAFDPARISATDYRIVYAIVAKWKGRSLTQALPFFSKVNLRRHLEDLTRMGYGTAVARVQA
jgi:uncharacterized protein (TIGR04141 family)